MLRRFSASLDHEGLGTFDVVVGAEAVEQSLCGRDLSPLADWTGRLLIWVLVRLLSGNGVVQLAGTDTARGAEWNRPLRDYTTLEFSVDVVPAVR